MTSTPNGPAATQPPAVAAKIEKPTLAGSRIKQRKGVAKSQAKFEPEAFRDALYKYFDSVSSAQDWDGYATALDKAGNTLDYRKYSDQLFEILITGNLLAPGGSPLDDAAPSRFSVFSAKSEAIEDVKNVVTVLDKLIRRYKFLQKSLEESSIRYLLQYITRFEPAQRQRLAVATGLLIQQGIITAGVLLVLQKDALAKDDVAIQFVEVVLRSYLVEGNMEALASALRKGGIKDALLFFPQTKRAQANIVTSYFKSANLAPVAEYFAKRAARDARDAIVVRLREMREAIMQDRTPEDQEATGGGREDEAIEYLREQQARMGVPADEFVPIVWEGLMKDLDFSSRPDQIEQMAVKLCKQIVPVLEPFCPSPKSEIALINTIQLHCYTEAQLLKAFVGFLKVLYNGDVISDSAIIFWHQKGAKPQGKETFLAAAAPLVKFLEEDDDDE